MATEQGAAGLLGTGVGVVTIGDESYQALPVDKQILTTIPLTAARTVTLPAASSVGLGATSVLVADLAGGVTNANTLSVAPNGTDKINGANAAKAINAAFGSLRFISNGVNGWCSVV